MASAAAPKKCARLVQSGWLEADRRSQASWTSAVGWSVWPAGSDDILYAAMRRNSALAEAKAVLQQDDSNHYALDLEGRCLRDLKRYDEADAVAGGLIAGDPNDLKAAYLKVTIAESRRDFACMLNAAGVAS